jgi:NCAIR mutase (PurE)-related protein
VLALPWGHLCVAVGAPVHFAAARTALALKVLRSLLAVPLVAAPVPISFGVAGCSTPASSSLLACMYAQVGACMLVVNLWMWRTFDMLAARAGCMALPACTP